MTLFAQNERNRSISHRQLMQMLYVSAGSRIFFLLVIDMPELNACVWMAPLLGLAFASPTLLCTYALLREGRMRLSPFLRETVGAPVWRAALIVFSLAMTYNASSLFEALLSSAAYATLYMTPGWILAIPTFLVPVIVASRGGNSAGGLGAVFLRAVPLLYLLVIVFQFRSINLAWLTPLFGSGAHALLHSARLCATYYCMIPIGLLLDDGENTTAPNFPISPDAPLSSTPLSDALRLPSITISALFSLCEVSKTDVSFALFFENATSSLSFAPLKLLSPLKSQIPSSIFVFPCAFSPYMIFTPSCGVTVSCSRLRKPPYVILLSFIIPRRFRRIR